ncbi:MAG: hypothetical protein AAGC68_14095, partial [Verrucomicrobiota bacterium]
MQNTKLRTVASLLLAIVALSWCSCAKLPARLDRTHAVGQAGMFLKRESLHRLIELSLVTPNEGESAYALGHVVEKWREEYGVETCGYVDPEADSQSRERFLIRFTARGPARFLPGYFDELNPAADFRVRKLERHTKEGIGTPMRALRENTGRTPLEHHYPPEAITREVTAVLHERGRSDGTKVLEIELLCALYHESVAVGGKRSELAADYSVALASLLERAKDLSRAEVADLFSSSPTRDPKLYLLEPYDPRKEPLVMIHGLLDSPLAWAELTNSLRSDPEIRKRYQIWHYLYNTSAPALYSGRLLRTQYRDLRRELDPGLNDRASKR